jgi:hypothetical protein
MLKNKIKKELFNMSYLFNVITSILKILFKLIYFLIFITLPIFLLYYWNFKYVGKIIYFLKISWWPLVTVFTIFLFKDNIAKLIDELSELDIFGNKAKRGNQPPSQEKSLDKTEDIKKDKEIYEQSQEIIKTLSNDVNILKNQLANKEIELDFERIYNVIYGSQINILTYLNDSNATINLNQINKYYKDVQKNQHPFLNNIDMSQYLSFLTIISRLLESVELDNYRIAAKGKAFLKYIKEIRQYNLNKPF